MAYEVGDVVEAVTNLVTDCDVYGPSLCAKAGEHLVISAVRSPFSYRAHKASIKKPGPGDEFYVRDSELELVRGVNEDLSNLAYSVVFDPEINRLGTLDSWDKVAKVLKLFKQKKHKGFYLEVEELARGRGYKVRVFRDV